MVDLDAIYKQGNVTSHEEGLRLVYEKGRYDATPRMSDMALPGQVTLIDNLSTVYDPTPVVAQVTEVVETPVDNNPTEQSSIISETNT